MSTKGKVISLADHRRERLAIVGWRWDSEAPVNRDKYDAWVETDGSLVLRIDAKAVTHEKRGGAFGREGETPVFRIRGDAYELRIAPIDVRQMADDIMNAAHNSRRIQEYRRGDHLWRCTPRGDGTYDVEHEQTRGVFEPFVCKLRAGHVPRGDDKGSERRRGVEAPKCDACRRVVQAGETMYRERREKSIYGKGLAWHKFGHAELCSTCIQRAPGEGIRDVGAEGTERG